MPKKFEKRTGRWAATALLMLVVTIEAAGAGDPINKSWTGQALKGFDAVAYFTEGKPVKGSSQYAYQWSGAKWLFASAANRDAFAAAPEKYAPQYGGYCAYGVSEGHKAPIDPSVWTIVDGRLYLNYNAEVGGKWREDIPGRIARANKNWPEIKDK